MMKIAAHTLVKNEARFLWFSVMSVIEYVDRIFIWDTGSTDGTLDMIQKMRETKYGKKVKFREYGEVTKESFADVRQAMLDETDEDWFLVVDGDEIWWDDSIAEITRFIRKHEKKFESIVVPTVNLVGDIYHFQEEEAGLYRLAGRRGHLNLRGVNRRIPGLRSYGEHGVWGWVDEDKKMVQDRNQAKIKFIEAPYLHASFLRRAGDVRDEAKVPKRKKKLKHEVGMSFPADYYYPEVFFRKRPEIVECPWERMGGSFYARALIETPLRKFKRRYLPSKVGY